MPEFLKLVTPKEALALLWRHFPTRNIRTELVDTINAFGRVAASAIISPEPLPAFPRSTVDGFAVRAVDTFGASETMPAYLSLVGEVSMGCMSDLCLQPLQAGIIHTGGMLPKGADAVIMMENTQTTRPGEVEVLRSVAVGENVIRIGEDIEKDQEIMSSGTLLGPAEIGGLMALGLINVRVVCPPRVGILSSGDEVVSPDVHPNHGQIRDVNSYSLSVLVQQCGGQPVRYGIASDRADLLHKVAANALRESDMLIITAGSSASTRDLTAEVIQSMGSPGVLVHGVNIRPGKPTILAVCDGKVIIGLPGNPVSALIVGGLFIKPVIHRMLGIPLEQPKPVVPAILTINVPSITGREEWIPVSLFTSQNSFLAEPIFYKSNLIFTLVRADGIFPIPADATGLEAGQEVQVILM